MEYLRKTRVQRDAGFLYCCDVIEMFSYYKEHGCIPADSDIDAIVNDMKPWYDNYCFAEEALIRVSECLIAIWCFTILQLYGLRTLSSADDRPEYQD